VRMTRAMNRAVVGRQRAARVRWRWAWLVDAFGGRVYCAHDVPPGHRVAIAGR
jgi:hypothetical protein